MNNGTLGLVSGELTKITSVIEHETDRVNSIKKNDELLDKDLISLGQEILGDKVTIDSHPHHKESKHMKLSSR